MKAIVSVFAKDSKGITAYVTALLAEKDINILDITQTILDGKFMANFEDYTLDQFPGRDLRIGSQDAIRQEVVR